MLNLLILLNMTANRWIQTLVASDRSSTCRRPGSQHWADWLSWRWHPPRQRTPLFPWRSDGPTRRGAWEWSRSGRPPAVWEAERLSRCWRWRRKRRGSSCSCPALWRSAPATRPESATAAPTAAHTQTGGQRKTRIQEITKRSNH